MSESPGPQHEMSDADAQREKWTNTELSQYRLSGMRPDRIEDHETQVYRQQTAGISPRAHAAQYAALATPQAPAEFSHRPEFQAVEAFAAWSPGQLQRLCQTGPEQAAQAVAIAREWTAAAALFSDYTGDPDLRTAAHLAVDHLGALASTPGIAPTTAADLLDSVGLMADGYFIPRGNLGDIIAAQPVPTMLELMSRDTGAGEQAHSSLISHYRAQPDTPGRATEIATTVMGPFVDRLRHDVSTKGLDSVNSSYLFIRDTAVDLSRQPAALAAATAQGYDRQQTADSVLEALRQQQSLIRPGYPTHDQAHMIADMLQELYRPLPSDQPVIPDTLVPFLRKLYTEKAKSYHSMELERMNRTFQDTAHTLHLDLSEIKRKV